MEFPFCKAGALGAMAVLALTIVVQNTSAQAPPPVSFDAAIVSPAGGNTWSVAAGDLNGDAKPDLVVANYSLDGINVLLGKADGTFEAPVTYPAGDGPGELKLGDFNGDGKLDIAVANVTSQDVSILLGNGNGTFQFAQPYAVGGSAGPIAVGDFDGDGILDLAVGNGTEKEIDVLISNGNGSFQAPLSRPTGFGSNWIAVSDLNGDGKLDLVTANFSTSNVSVLLGKGNGDFEPSTAYSVGGQCYVVGVGDLNGDGKLDLATANYSSNNVSVLLGTGTGTFQPAVDYPIGSPSFNPDHIVVDDFNGDGKLDLATSNYSSNNVSLLFGDGSGTFQTTELFDVARNPQAVIVSDINSDGHLDLVMTVADNSVSVLLGKADGTFAGAPTYILPYPPTSITVGDFDGDDKMDVALGTSAPNGSPVSVFLGKGDGTFSTRTDFSTPYYPRSIAAADLDADSKLDLVTAAGGASVLLGNGNGTFQPVATYGTGGNAPYSVAVGNFNNDGYPDLAVANYQASLLGYSVGVLLNDGNGAFPTAASYVAGTQPVAVAVGDFKGDGYSDFVVANSGSSNVSVFLNTRDGTSAFQNAASYVVGANPTSVAVGDFSGDGKTDLAVAVSSNNAVKVLKNNGDGTFGAEVTHPVMSNPKSVTVGDFNGDGKLDLAAVNSTSQTLSVLVGNGDGTFQKAVNYATGRQPVSVAVGDFNGDGKPDLAVANNTDGNFSVFLNATKIATSIALSSSSSPSTVGEPVTLTATVTASSGTPDGTVTFMEASTTLGTATLNSGGEATLTTSSLPAGVHSITAVYGGKGAFGGSTSAVVTQTVNKQNQTITFGPLADRQLADSSFTVTGNASSGLPVTFSASGNCTASGPTVTLTGAGSCTITASQSGDATYNAAPDVPQSFMITAQVAPTATFTGAPASAAYHSTFTVSATTNASSTAILTASGACSISDNAVTITSGTGTCSLTASWAADATYSAISASQTTTATKAPLTVTAGGYSGTYDGAPHLLTACVVSTNPDNVSCSNIPLGPVGPDVGSGIVTASSSADTGNYAVTADNGLWSITPLTVTITAGNYSGTFDNNIHAISPCTSSFAGIACANDPSSVGPGMGSGIVTPVPQIKFGKSEDYVLVPMNSTWNITEAASTVTLSCPFSVVYTGSPQTPCTATVTGSGGLSQSLTVSYSNNIVGTATATASYPGDANHAGRNASKTFSIAYSIGACLGDLGHTILQPINADGTSVWKQGRTIPAKFRVCDANGVSVGTPGVVSSFYLIQIISGTITNVDEVVDATNNDTAFRWDGNQWIFNINTRNLSVGYTYVYAVTLNDGSVIRFQDGLAARGASLGTRARTSEVCTGSVCRIVAWRWARASSGRSKRRFGLRTRNWHPLRGIRFMRS